MGVIKLNKIENNAGLLVFSFDISKDLVHFFNFVSFSIEYRINNSLIDLSDVPCGVLAIPFICNILPIIWLTDSVLIIDELDRFFYDSIPDFKQGYIDMYPDADFKGRIIVKKLTENKPIDTGKSATFFSGGLDAWCTLVRHISENPVLILLWGADIPLSNENGWNKLYGTVKKTAEENALDLITVKSSYRDIINTVELDRAFFPLIHDGWWHGIQHGIALIGHSAPCDYYMGVNKQYIAASFSPEDKKVTCASYPTIDNNVRFFNCQVYHDAFVSRDKKTEEIVSYRKNSGNGINLHVCWETIDGENCCQCEKCIRTIIGIMLNGDYPYLYGFSKERVSFDYMENYMLNEYDFSQFPFVKLYWQKYQDLFKQRKKALKKTPYYNKIKWLDKLNFTNRKQKPFLLRFRHLLSSFVFYQKLSQVKKNIKNL